MSSLIPEWRVIVVYVSELLNCSTIDTFQFSGLTGNNEVRVHGYDFLLTLVGEI